MLFSVIVPHHTETVEEMKPLLESLDSQQIVNFDDVELLIINDNKKSQIKPEDLREYPKLYKNARTFFNKREGYMGISRQIGLDNSYGEFITFCDADDMLFTPLSLFMGLSELQNSPQIDACYFNFYEQKDRIIEHQDAITWCFSKVFRSQSLKKFNIRFSDKLRFHEDSYFIQVCGHIGLKIKYSTFPFYFWRYNKDSVTRKDCASYSKTSLIEFVDALDERLERLSPFLTEEQRRMMNISDIVYMYMQLQSRIMLSLLDEARPNLEQRLRDYLLKYDPSLEMLSQKYLVFLTQEIQRVFSSEKFLVIPNEGFEHFLYRLLEKQEEETQSHI